MTIPVGTKLGRYEIRSKIGEGGMGEVYLAEDTQLHRKVALKILPAEVSANSDRMRRFEQEATAAAALNHPNIAHIYEIGEHDGVNFIAMEFIDGQTLRKKIYEERTELGKLLRFLQHAAEGLARAHAAGIVHRDLKPDNIMITRDGQATSVDFGLAKLIERSRPGGVSAEEMSAMPTAVMPQHSLPGMVLGTVGYMSPEQAQGRVNEIDHRSDIFSFGCILFEAATGRKPFEGKDTLDSLHKIVHAPTPQLRDFDPDAPDELQKIVRRCLAKDPDDRYHSIKDVAIELKELRRELEASAMDITVPPSIDVESAGGANPAATGQVLGSATSNPPASLSTEASSAQYILAGITQHKLAAVISVVVLAVGIVGLAAYLHARSPDIPIDSIAVLPFVNESGNNDVEYLSDGMTESLIDSLSQLPHLSVKARSSVFRYKGKEADPQQVASQLSVQAILTGRMVQRGDNLTLYLSLVDGRNGNQIWGDHYDRKMTNLISLQSEIARDVSNKLRVKLSSADEQRLTKSYTANTEAYELYLKGRYHVFKMKLPEAQTGISYFQQAIEIDPNYALAYVGLANAYRSFALSGDMPAEFFPKAKDAAQKAVEIDDHLAEAHAVLGFTIFWYDWNWKVAENQFQRALELNPNSADAHWFYATFLSSMGRNSEALNEVTRARELDPLNLIIGAAEGQFLLHGGRADEALASSQKTIELDPNFWFAHMLASDAYTEKGRFTEAIAEARKAAELSGANSHSLASLGYALARSGKQGEARAVLDGLLKLSTERHVSPHNIALVYIGLGEPEEALAWLERAFEQRDGRMVFLKVEPKWNNLRGDPRFQDLLRRLSLTQ
jgi:eukaryotic-like serine/threonine-protein kinase